MHPVFFTEIKQRNPQVVPCELSGITTRWRVWSVFTLQISISPKNYNSQARKIIFPRQYDKQIAFLINVLSRAVARIANTEVSVSVSPSPLQAAITFPPNIIQNNTITENFNSTVSTI